MGPAPSASDLAKEKQETSIGLYDAETQQPGGIEHLNDDLEVPGTTADAKDDTDFLDPVVEEKLAVPDSVAELAVKPRVESAVESEGRRVSVGKTSVVGGEQEQTFTEKSIDESSAKDKGLAYSEQAKDQVADIVKGKKTAGLKPTEACSKKDEGVCVENLDVGGSGGAEGGCEDEGEAFEPPTQAMALEFDRSIDDKQEGRDQTAPGETESAPAGAVVGAAARNFRIEPTGQEECAHRDENGDETADEADSAALFYDIDDQVMRKSLPTPGAGDGAVEQIVVDEVDEPSSLGLSATPMTPLTAPQYVMQSGQVTSPGGVSDVSTQKQESPAYQSSLQERVGPVRRDGGRREIFRDTGEDSINDKEAGSVGETRLGEGGQEDSDDHDEDDEGSDASGALIPAEVLEELENDEVYNAPETEEQNNKGETAPDSVGGEGVTVGNVNDPGGAGLGAVENDSGSETDATGINSDEEPTDQACQASPKPHSADSSDTTPSKAGSLVTGKPTSVSGGSTSYVMTLGDAHSPGGSLLIQTSTEDAMQAIAREHQRAEAARSAGLVAQAGAGDIANDSEDDEDEKWADTEIEAVEEETIPMGAEEETKDEEEKEEEEGITETCLVGTEIVEETELLEQFDDAVSTSTIDDQATENPKTGDLDARTAFGGSTGLTLADTSDVAHGSEDSRSGSDSPAESRGRDRALSYESKSKKEVKPKGGRTRRSSAVSKSEKSEDAGKTEKPEGEQGEGVSTRKGRGLRKRKLGERSPSPQQETATDKLLGGGSDGSTPSQVSGNIKRRKRGIDSTSLASTLSSLAEATSALVEAEKNSQPPSIRRTSGRNKGNPSTPPSGRGKGRPSRPPAVPSTPSTSARRVGKPSPSTSSRVKGRQSQPPPRTSPGPSKSVRGVGVGDGDGDGNSRDIKVRVFFIVHEV